MRKLFLNYDLEPADGGENQQEISDWIENDQRWIDYVDSENAVGIPENSERELRPTEEWLDCQEFLPTDLVNDACLDLKWASAPENLCLTMNFSLIKQH